MRRAVASFVLNSLLLNSAWASLRSKRADFPNDRDLSSALSGGGAKRCQRELSTCQKSTGGYVALPTEKWIDLLDRIASNNNDPYVADLKKIVLAASEPADFSPIVNSVKENPGILDVNLLLTQSETLEDSESSDKLETMKNILENLGDVARQVNFNPGATFFKAIVFALELTAGILNLISGDPTAISIIVFTLQNLAKFISTFLVSLFRVGFLGSDVECNTDLVNCAYTSTMLNVVPSLLAGVFLAEGVNPDGVAGSQSTATKPLEPEA